MNVLNAVHSRVLLLLVLEIQSLPCVVIEDYESRKERWLYWIATRGTKKYISHYIVILMPVCNMWVLTMTPDAQFAFNAVNRAWRLLLLSHWSWPQLIQKEAWLTKLRSPASPATAVEMFHGVSSDSQRLAAPFKVKKKYTHVYYVYYAYQNGMVVQQLNLSNAAG